MNDTQRRITELDGIRGLAALGVVIYHYHRHFHVAPLEAVLFPVYRGGNFLVDLFFILSGFILAQVYAREARYPTFGSAIQSRVARLYPLHILTLLLVAPLQKFHVIFANHCFAYTQNDWWHLFLNLLLLNESGLQTGFSFNGPAWSISTEFIVNIIFLAVALGSPVRARWLGAILVVGLLSFDLSVMQPDPPHAFMPFIRLFRCFFSFGVGLLLHAASERLPLNRLPIWIVEALLLGAAVGALTLMANPWHSLNFYGTSLLCFPAIILLSVLSRGLALLRTRPLVLLGHSSYSLYLLHFPLELVLKDLELAAGIRMPYDSVALFSVYLAVVCIASFATYRYFEIPARRAVKRFKGIGIMPRPIAIEVKH